MLKIKKILIKPTKLTKICKFLLIFSEKKLYFLDHQIRTVTETQNDFDEEEEWGKFFEENV